MTMRIDYGPTTKISIPKIRSQISSTEYRSEDFIMLPITKLLESETHSLLSGWAVAGVVCGGTAKIVAGGQYSEVRSDMIFLILDGHEIESFKCSKACVGYVLAFSPKYVAESHIGSKDMLTTDMAFVSQPCIVIDRFNAWQFNAMAMALHMSVKGGAMYGDYIVESLFSALFYALSSVKAVALNSEPSIEENMSRGDILMRDFIALLGRDCQRERSVEYYAAQLGITPKYLSLISNKKTGKSASKLIEEAVIHVAKELLMQPGLSILEVSEQLNFVSQSFFGKYFKQRVGVSPSRYKVQNL